MLGYDEELANVVISAALGLIYGFKLTRFFLGHGKRHFQSLAIRELYEASR